jgi:hypothetical protein
VTAAHLVWAADNVAAPYIAGQAVTWAGPGGGWNLAAGPVDVTALIPSGGSFLLAFRVLNQDDGSGSGLDYKLDIEYSVCGSPAPGPAQPNNSSILSRAVPDLKAAPGLSLPAGKDLVVGPNPASGRAYAFFRLAEAGQASLLVSNVLGETVLRSASQAWDAGVHKQDLDVGALAPGIYIVQLIANAGPGWGLRAAFKMAVIRR